MIRIPFDVSDIPGPHPKYKVTYHDTFGPALVSWEKGANEALDYLATHASSKVEDAIKEEFFVFGRRGTRWPALSPAWIKAKGHDTKLLYTGELDKNVENIRLRSGWSDWGNRFFMSGIAQSFISTPYVFFHEYALSMPGVTHPQRDFIERGILSGLTTTSQAMAEAMGHIDKTITKRERQANREIRARSSVGAARISSPGAVNYKLTPTEMTRGWAETKYKFFSLGGWIWWVVPPSQWWAVLGKYADFKALMAGSLATSSAITAWLQALLMGLAGAQVGVPATKKSARRKYRRRGWRKVGYKK